MPPRTTKKTRAKPNPAPFPYADYAAARKQLMAALLTECFYAIITGKSGMGKTWLVRDISSHIDRHRNHIIYLSAANASVTGIARVIGLKLHVTPRRSFLENVQVLTEAICSQSSHLVVWIDEADQVSPETLSELRVLAESDLLSGQSFSVVLSGLPQLMSHLDTPALFPLKRRLTHRITLAGLRRDELNPFLIHRFGTEDAQRLSPAVRNEIFERTQATPALVDQIVRHAFLSANGNKGAIDADIIREVLDTAGL